MTTYAAELDDLDTRSREIFRRVVEMYLKDGDPVGSRTLSRSLQDPLSPASIRNVMQDLELAGLIAAPHVSAGRIPTENGLRLFLDGFLQIGEISPDERASIENALSDDAGIQHLLDEAGQALSGLSRCASLVIAPKRDAPIKHIEVAPLSDGRALAVIATADGAVENRLLQTPVGLTPSAIAEATNFMNAHMRGLTLKEARFAVSEGITRSRAELDMAAQTLIEAGFAEWSVPGDSEDARLIVRGLSNLIAEDTALDELESVRKLFDELERKRDLAQVLELAEGGEGVRVFIGAESKLFSHSGSALIISPYMDTDQNIIGALGVIGPTRLNYARILPIVDYTARLVGELVGKAGRRS